MTDKEVCFKFYAMSRAEPERFEAIWADEQVKYPRSGSDPVYSETEDYTLEEVKALHIFDNRRFWLAKRKPRKVEQSQSTQESVSIGQKPAYAVVKLGATEFMRELKVGFEALKPVDIKHQAIYTAARNLGMKVSVRQRGNDVVVIRLA